MENFMKLLGPYITLFAAVFFGTLSNTFANSANGFTKVIPSTLSAVTIIACMYCLSIVMKSMPVGITYASFAGFCIIFTTVVGVVKFQQIPNTYTIIGMILIILGVFLVNVLGSALAK